MNNRSLDRLVSPLCVLFASVLCQRGRLLLFLFGVLFVVVLFVLHVCVSISRFLIFLLDVGFILRIRTAAIHLHRVVASLLLDLFILVIALLFRHLARGIRRGKVELARLSLRSSPFVNLCKVFSKEVTLHGHSAQRHGERHAIFWRQLFHGCLLLQFLHRSKRLGANPGVDTVLVILNHVIRAILPVQLPDVVQTQNRRCPPSSRLWRLFRVFGVDGIRSTLRHAQARHHEIAKKRRFGGADVVGKESLGVSLERTPRNVKHLGKDLGEIPKREHFGLQPRTDARVLWKYR